MYFDGKEVDKFTTYTGAIATSYKPSKNLKLKLIASAFRTNEEETFDIAGAYLLNEIDKQIGSSTLGDSTMNLGVGSFLDHARNYLNATVLSLSHKGIITHANNSFLWGVKFQHEKIDDHINEWKLLDSAGYSLPYSSEVVNLSQTLIADNELESNRITSYIENAYTWDINNSELNITGGLRTNYWDFNNEFLVSPRVSLAYQPGWNRSFLFRLASGLYYQPPFYKELRDFNGNINYDIKAQQSLHFVVGSDYDFMAWNRQFKFISEIYYKKLENLIPNY
jgi:hypothetical protein